MHHGGWLRHASCRLRTSPLGMAQTSTQMIRRARLDAEGEHILTSLSSLIFLLFCASSSAQSTNPPSSGCHRQQCGEIVVRYPFALLESACPTFSTFFLLSCDTASNKLFVNISDAAVQVTDITSDSLIVDISDSKATFALVNASSCIGGGLTFIILPPYPSPFVISDDNLFGGFGCHQYSFMVTGRIQPLESSLAPTPNPSYANNDIEYGTGYTLANNLSVDGCGLVCYDKELPNPVCGNQTCCTASLAPKSAPRYVLIMVQSTGFDPATSSCNPDDIFSILFHPNYTDFEKESYQLQLNWALPFDGNDEKGIFESSNYACSSNSAITLVDGVPGFLCSCRPGYGGDGYSEGSGCTDINECILGNECVPESTCHNEEGNYTCRCNRWFYSGDGRIDGSGCHVSHSVRLATTFGTVGASIFIVVSSCVYVMVWWERRTRRKYFVQNGGLEFEAVLKERLGRDPIRLFTAKELEMATKNYAEGMKLGVGGSGMVFKGVLLDGKLVAIKRAKNMGSRDGGDSELFFNEIAILIQINHRHIVRILGCCFETEVPLLVYEYVSNGSLEENLASMTGSGVVSWEERLKVARQAGEALAYLHAAASPPILHRDVKSANVLLDNNWDAKIADFGLSCLIPDKAKQLATAIQGTIGYLDPEYFYTLQLTDKSDVYSFGVMLAELITGLKPVDSQNRDARFANLALLFVETLSKGSLYKIIDPRLGYTSDTQSHIRPSVMAVATLAFHCLALEGSARPCMNQVAHELHRITDSLHDFEIGQDGEASPPLSIPKESTES